MCIYGDPHNEPVQALAASLITGICLKPPLRTTSFEASRCMFLSTTVYKFRRTSHTSSTKNDKSWDGYISEVTHCYLTILRAKVVRKTAPISGLSSNAILHFDPSHHVTEHWCLLNVRRDRPTRWITLVIKNEQSQHTDSKVEGW